MVPTIMVLMFRSILAFHTPTDRPVETGPADGSLYNTPRPLRSAFRAARIWQFSSPNRAVWRPGHPAAWRLKKPEYLLENKSASDGVADGRNLARVSLYSIA